MNIDQHRTVLVARQIGSFACELGQYSRRTFLPTHRHDPSFMTVILAGGWRSITALGTRDHSMHSLGVHAAGEKHSVMFGDEPTTVLSIEGGAFERSAVLTTPAARTMASRLLEEFQAPDEISSIAIEALMLEARVAIGRRPRDERTPTWLREVHRAMEQRFSETLTLRTLAEHVDIDPAHLSREFHRYYGMTVVERLRQFRVAHAQRLLASSMPLQMIALDSGFADQSHLTRTFRRVTGTTPAQFRRTLARRGPSSSEPHRNESARSWPAVLRAMK